LQDSTEMVAAWSQHQDFMVYVAGFMISDERYIKKVRPWRSLSNFLGISASPFL